jgi:hypothetical protein
MGSSSCPPFRFVNGFGLNLSEDILPSQVDCEIGGRATFAWELEIILAQNLNVLRENVINNFE